jgi:hypothetical protein
MKHFSITFFSGLVFLGTLLLGGSLPALSDAVSRETTIGERFRETFAVKQGVSQDGLLAITLVPAVPAIPPRMKMANHERTLRAFFAPNRGGVPTLYVERVKPHEYYALVGGFIPADAYPVIAWTSPTTLMFYGSTPAGELMRYAADVRLLTFSQTPMVLAELPDKNTPLESILP